MFLTAYDASAISHKALKELWPLQQTGLKALWQAALKAVSGAWCQRCQQAATIEHVLYDCTMRHSHQDPPLELRALGLKGGCPSMWSRGLFLQDSECGRLGKLQASTSPRTPLGFRTRGEGPVVWGLEQAAKPHRRAVGLGLGLCGLQVSGLSWV